LEVEDTEQNTREVGHHHCCAKKMNARFLHDGRDGVEEVDGL
jgi:hypothetical protein